MTGHEAATLLFLCTGNSARSILAEAIANRLGAPDYRAFSAGSDPTGRVNPLALELLTAEGYDTGDLRSKSWDAFAAPGAPVIDIVITVCDNAAGEVCPVWPGQPVTAHWGIADPAAIDGDDATRRAAFVTAYRLLEKRIAGFVSGARASTDPGDTAALLNRLATVT